MKGGDLPQRRTDKNGSPEEVELSGRSEAFKLFAPHVGGRSKFTQALGAWGNGAGAVGLSAFLGSGAWAGAASTPQAQSLTAQARLSQPRRLRRKFRTGRSARGWQAGSQAGWAQGFSQAGCSQATSHSRHWSRRWRRQSGPQAGCLQAGCSQAGCSQAGSQALAASHALHSGWPHTSHAGRAATRRIKLRTGWGRQVTHSGPQAGSGTAHFAGSQASQADTWRWDANKSRSPANRSQRFGRSQDGSHAGAGWAHAAQPSSRLTMRPKMSAPQHRPHSIALIISAPSSIVFFMERALL